MTHNMQITCTNGYLGSGDQLRPMAPRINNITKKFHIVVVSNFNGNSYFEVLQDGCSINSERYIRFCENAFDSLKLTNIQRHSIQSMHDNYNAPPVSYTHLTLPTIYSV